MFPLLAERVFLVDDLLALVLGYLNVYDSVLFYRSCYQALIIPQSLHSLVWDLSHLTELDQIFPLDLSTFLTHCPAFERIHLSFIFENEFEVCLVILSHLRQCPRWPLLKDIWIQISDDFPDSISTLCWDVLHTFSNEQFGKIESLLISFPPSFFDNQAESINATLNSHHPNLCEVFGTEVCDNLFHELHHFHLIGFLDVVSWSQLRVLHLGNLLSRFFVITEQHPEGETTHWMEQFLTKFTRSRFPAVTTLHFDDLDDDATLFFFSTLARFLFQCSEVESQTYLWSTISTIKFDRFPNRMEDPYLVRNRWMEMVRNIQMLHRGSSGSRTGNGTAIPTSNGTISIFQQLSSLQICGSLPSLHFIPFLCTTLNSQTYGLRLTGFMDDPLFQQYLETPSLHPSPIGIRELIVYERLCDFQLLQEKLFSSTNFSRFTLNKRRNFTPNSSYLDSFLNLIPQSSFPDYLTSLSSKHLSYNSHHLHHGLHSFLTHDSHSLTLLHLNESQFIELCLNSCDDTSQPSIHLFGQSSSQLQIVIIELDLFCREVTLSEKQNQNEKKQRMLRMKSLIWLIQNFQMKETQEFYSHLKMIQFNVWSSTLETLFKLDLEDLLRTHHCLSGRKNNSCEQNSLQIISTTQQQQQQQQHDSLSIRVANRRFVVCQETEPTYPPR
jgi:hypothetical protein